MATYLIKNWRHVPLMMTHFGPDDIQLWITAISKDFWQFWLINKLHCEGICESFSLFKSWKAWFLSCWHTKTKVCFQTLFLHINSWCLMSLSHDFFIATFSLTTATQSLSQETGWWHEREKKVQVSVSNRDETPTRSKVIPPRVREFEVSAPWRGHTNRWVCVLYQLTIG